MSTFLNAIPAAVWTLIGTVVGSVLTHVFSGPRFRRERLWEARSSAYGNVINFITKSEHFASRLDRDFKEEDPHSVFHGERYPKLAKLTWKNYNKARREIRLSYVAFSGPMLTMLADLDAKLDATEWDALDPPDQWRANAEILAKGKLGLRNQARRELAPTLRQKFQTAYHKDEVDRS